MELAEFKIKGTDNQGKKFEFNIYSNIGTDGNINSLSAALDNWGTRTKEFTSKSLCEYINSKGIHLALDAIPKREIKEVAADIIKIWKKPSQTAIPYLKAMFELTDKNSKYGLDGAVDIVTRFLINATAFRGPEANEIKKELKWIIK
jgi:hypothetical protein